MEEPMNSNQTFRYSTWTSRAFNAVRLRRAVMAGRAEFASVPIGVIDLAFWQITTYLNRRSLRQGR
jgi:hypothetical protein